MSLWQRISDFFGTLDAGGLVRSIGTALDPDKWLPGGRDAAFTVSLVALSAKMAVADGIVTNSEVTAFKSLVDIPRGSEAQIERLFELAQQDVTGYQSYAKKISRLFGDSPETLEQVVQSLFYIASADGMIHEQELEYLKSISDIFGFDDAKFEQIASAYMISDGGDGDPYLVLGLSPDVSDDELRKTYRRLVREHHPDSLIAKGVPEEMLALATGRMAAINAAYSVLSQSRNL